MVLLSGCAGASYYTSGTTTHNSEEFAADLVRIHRVALLPVIAGEDLEGYKRPFGEALNDALGEYVEPGSFITWEATMDSLNAHGVVEQYQSAITGYRQTGIINRSVLQQMAAATGTRYFLYVHLDPPRSGADIAGVDALGRVWDAEGDVVWEGVGSSTFTGTLGRDAAELSALSANASDALVRSMLGYEVAERTEVPGSRGRAAGATVGLVGLLLLLGLVSALLEASAY